MIAGSWVACQLTDDLSAVPQVSAWRWGPGMDCVGTGSISAPGENQGLGWGCTQIGVAHSGQGQPRHTWHRDKDNCGIPGTSTRTGTATAHLGQAQGQ